MALHGAAGCGEAWPGIARQGKARVLDEDT